MSIDFLPYNKQKLEPIAKFYRRDVPTFSSDEEDEQQQQRADHRVPGIFDIEEETMFNASDSPEEVMRKIREKREVTRQWFNEQQADIDATEPTDDREADRNKAVTRNALRRYESMYVMERCTEMFEELVPDNLADDILAGIPLLKRMAALYRHGKFAEAKALALQEILHIAEGIVTEKYNHMEEQVNELEARLVQEVLNGQREFDTFRDDWLIEKCVDNILTAMVDDDTVMTFPAPVRGDDETPTHFKNRQLAYIRQHRPRVIFRQHTELEGIQDRLNDDVWRATREDELRQGVQQQQHAFQGSTHQPRGRAAPPYHVSPVPWNRAADGSPQDPSLAAGAEADSDNTTPMETSGLAPHTASTGETIVGADEIADRMRILSVIGARNLAADFEDEWAARGLLPGRNMRRRSSNMSIVDTPELGVSRFAAQVSGLVHLLLLLGWTLGAYVSIHTTATLNVCRLSVWMQS